MLNQTQQDAIRSRLHDINVESERILKLCKSDADLTPDKENRLQELDDEFVELENLEDDDMSQKYWSDALKFPSQGRKSDPDDVVKNGSSGVLARANGEFRNFGDYALSVYSSGLQGHGIDPRLFRNAPTTISTEGTGSEGGYAVPVDYKSAIMQEVLGETSLLSLTDQHTTPSNEMHFPADETAPWDTTNGVQAYWESEAGQLTQSKVALKDKTIKLNKLTALIPVTSELLEDAPSLNAYLSRKVQEKFVSKLNTAIVSGTGVGEPQGILNCPSLVSIAAESGQSADTIVCSLG